MWSFGSTRSPSRIHMWPMDAAACFCLPANDRGAFVKVRQGAARQGAARQAASQGDREAARQPASQAASAFNKIYLKGAVFLGTIILRCPVGIMVARLPSNRENLGSFPGSATFEVAVPSWLAGRWPGWLAGWLAGCPALGCLAWLLSSWLAGGLGQAASVAIVLKLQPRWCVPTQARTLRFRRGWCLSV